MEYGFVCCCWRWLMWRQPDSALAVMMDYFAGRDALMRLPRTIRTRLVCADFGSAFEEKVVILFRNALEISNEVLEKFVMTFEFAKTSVFSLLLLKISKSTSYEIDKKILDD